MSKGNKSTLEKMRAFELKYLSGVKGLVATNPDEEAYLDRVARNDGHLAEIKTITSEVSGLQVLRTHIYRGRFSDAEVLAKQLENQDPDEMLTIELKVERARLAGLAGRWNECIEICNSGISGKTALSSLQIFIYLRAIGFFELGEFSASLRDLQTLESFQRLLPSSSTSIYSNALQAKIFSYQSQLVKARTILDELWSTLLRAKMFNLDSILSLLRVETHWFLNSSLAPTDKAAKVSNLLRSVVAISKVTAEDLYRSEAELALHFLSGGRVDQIEPEHLKFERISLVKSALTGADQAQSTGLVFYRRLIELSESAPATLSSDLPESLLFLSLGLLVKLKPFSVVPVKAGGREWQCFDLLAAGPVDREVLFKTVWQIKNYVPHLHQNLVYQNLSRIRKKYGVEIEASSGIFSLKRFALIDLKGTGR